MLEVKNNTNLISKVSNFIKKHKMLNDNDTVIVGLSGGADSVCLFEVLLTLRDDIDFDMVAVHVNHLIRGSEADKDEEYVKSLCVANGIECITYKKDIPAISKETGETEEECGRRIRYELFREVVNKLSVAKNGTNQLSKKPSVKIAVAHHMNDQAETILFRMARGTGIRGIAGMKPVHEDIIRPLLCVSREEIEEYLASKEIAFCEDYTNSDNNYSRNYIRNEIIPGLKSINSDAVDHICELAVMADEMERFVVRQVERVLCNARTQAGDRIVYNTKVIMQEDDFLLPYIIRGIFDENHISLKDVGRDHIAMISRMIYQSEAKSCDLPRGIKVIREADRLYILKGDYNSRKSQAEDINIPISEGVYELPNGARLMCRVMEDYDADDIPRNTYTKWFDYDKIFNGLCLRTRRQGDTIAINETGSVKKLKDYYIDVKIPKSERDETFILASDSKVYWVIGYRIAEDVKVTKKTRKVMEIAYIKED